MSEWLKGVVSHLTAGPVLAVLAAIWVVWDRTAGRHPVARCATCLASAAAGFSIGPEASAWAGTPPIMTTALVTVTAPVILGLASNVVGDRKLLLELIRVLRGGGAK